MRTRRGRAGGAAAMEVDFSTIIYRPFSERSNRRKRAAILPLCASRGFLAAGLHSSKGRLPVSE